VKIQVEAYRYESRGNRVLEAPNVFDLDEDDRVRLVDENPAARTPAGSRGRTTTA